MGDQTQQHKADDYYEKILNKLDFVRVVFRIISITLLSLLLPFAFLVLARFAGARFLLSQLKLSSPNSPVFLHINPSILYLLLSTISIATLVHTLSKRLISILQSRESRYIWPPLTLGYLHPYAAWIFLLTLLVSIDLGIKGTEVLSSDYYFSSFRTNRTLFNIEIFLLGLHETMLHWSRLVVEPVVNETFFGVVSRNERWVQRGVMAGSFGSLWYWSWRLRDEVVSLVVVVVAKVEILNMGMADFAGWFLYYMTVMIGVVKLIKVWIAIYLFCKRVSEMSSDEPSLDIEENV